MHLSLSPAVFENVGGEQLDLNLSVMRTLGRIAFCGSISQYNTNEPYAIKNIANLIKQQVRLEGFIVTTYQSRWPEALKQIKEWVASGKLSRQYDIVEGGPVRVNRVEAPSMVSSWRERKRVTHIRTAATALPC